MTLFPTKIHLGSPETLKVLWTDGHESPIPLRLLRDECPCAGCKGETILFESYSPPPRPELPGKYDLKQAEPVGHYALQVVWGDGHATGIYTWKLLRGLCQCTACTGTT